MWRLLRRKNKIQISEKTYIKKSCSKCYRLTAMNAAVAYPKGESVFPDGTILQKFVKQQIKGFHTLINFEPDFFYGNLD